MNEEDMLKEMEEQRKLELKQCGYSTDVALYDDATYSPVDIDFTTQQ